MFGNFPRPALTAAVGLLSATALAIGAPAVQAAPQPPALPAAPELPRPTPGGTNVLPIEVPFDNELAAALRFVKQLGGDKVLVEVLQAVIGAAGQISPLTAADQVPTPGVKHVDAAADPLSLLRQAGVHPLSPSVAPLCTAPTADNPLGIVSAGAAGIPGPWPLRTANPVSLLPFPLPGVTVPDPNVVKDKHTAFAFIPADAGVAGKGGKMQVAWFNTATMQGGMADLAPLADTNPVLKALPGLSGARLVPVDTGKGTILAAVYGTAPVGGNRECFFLPAVGIINS